jgi:hypothetical protein
VYGLDSNEGMLEYAAEKAEKEGASVKFLDKDMEEFTLPVRSLPAWRCPLWNGSRLQVKSWICQRCIAIHGKFLKLEIK